ncbi:MAG: hypothetical protein ABII64_05465 [Elusimicrobiota bacterium]
MLRSICAALACLLFVPSIFGFNLDPLSADLKLKKGEKHELLFRIKNIYKEPIIIEVSAIDKAAVHENTEEQAQKPIWITKIRPERLRLDKDKYTYLTAIIMVPQDSGDSLSAEIIFKVSGSKKKSKVDKTVAVPVSVTINADKKAGKTNTEK